MIWLSASLGNIRSKLEINTCSNFGYWRTYHISICTMFWFTAKPFFFVFRSSTAIVALSSLSEHLASGHYMCIASPHPNTLLYPYPYLRNISGMDMDMD